MVTDACGGRGFAEIAEAFEGVMVGCGDTEDDVGAISEAVGVDFAPGGAEYCGVRGWKKDRIEG